MSVPNESDIRLLQAIIALTRRVGEPPTLAELAEELGLDRSRRGNVHRKLSKLRPEYVTWDDQRHRSLQVTPKGERAIALANTKQRVPEQAPYKLLQIIASGIMHLSVQLQSERPRVPLFPSELQRGVNWLAVHCLTQQQEIPQDIEDVLLWATRPLRDWPIQFADTEGLQNSALIGEDQRPTEVCAELAELIIKGNAEHEAALLLLSQLVHRTRAINDAETQALYVETRRFLIEHPVIDRDALFLAGLRPPLSTLEGGLQELYEQIPSTHLLNGAAYCCGFCGWTLEHRGLGWRCVSALCAIATDSFTRGTTIVQPNDEPLMRVRRPIRTYVVAPGRPELALYEALRALGLRVDLWPQGDRYDLRVHISESKRWAIDVKAWSSAPALARLLRPIPLADDDEDSEVRMIYAIPDERASDEYMAYLSTAAQHQSFEVLTAREVLQEARNTLTGVKHA
ncbi:MAG: hypothetical protein OHK0022_07360 [Roseiflexaceae bacterium]